MPWASSIPYRLSTVDDRLLFPMPTSNDAPGARLLSLWRRLTPVPGGGRLFMLVIRRMVPYTGALGSRVRVLEPGHARVELRDRRGIRNHLRSVHAVALANLGEFTSGMAMMTGLPPATRGIVTELRVQFLKKARGLLTAECHANIPDVNGEITHDVTAEIRDEAGDLVARVTAIWNLRPPTRA